MHFTRAAPPFPEKPKRWQPPPPLESNPAGGPSDPSEDSALEEAYRAMAGAPVGVGTRGAQHSHTLVRTKIT